MNFPDFLDLVIRMRKAQRDYFATRDSTDLRESKRLEREVDSAIQVMRGGPSLFESPAREAT